MLRTRREPLIYSDEFRTAVMKAYPNAVNIKQMLDDNEYNLGRYLDDGTTSTIPVDTVLRMIENGQVNSLFNLAFDLKNKSNLSKMWDKEVFLD
jgi:hypothetical protein